MRLGLLVSLMMLGAETLLPASARAEEAQQDNDAELPRVELSIIGEASALEPLEMRIASWFRGQGTAASSKREASMDPDAVFSPAAQPGVRVWVVLRSSSAARLFFAVQERAGEPPRYLVSDVELDSGLDELGLEHLAQVCYVSATALWAGNLESSRQEVAQGLKLEAEPAPAAKPAPAPAAVDRGAEAGPEPTPTYQPALAAPRSVVVAGVELSVRYRGGEKEAIVPGAVLGGAWRQRGIELGGRLHAGLLLPQTLEASGVELELRGLSFALGATLAQQRAEHWWLVVEAGPGLEVVEYRTTDVSDPTLRASPGGTDLRPFAQLSGGARVELASLTLSAMAALAVHFTSPHYDIGEPTGDAELLSPSLLQPGVNLVAAWIGP
jgi:hypothetical protein